LIKALGARTNLASVCLWWGEGGRPYEIDWANHSGTDRDHGLKWYGKYRGGIWGHLGLKNSRHFGFWRKL